MRMKAGLWALCAMAGLLFCLWGCGNGGVGGGTPAVVQNTIGSAGGNIVDGNLTVAVPGSALTASTLFAVQGATAGQYPANLTLVPGTAYNITSTATTLAAAVTVSIRYNGAALPSGVQENTLELFQVVSGVWTLVTGSTLDVNNKVVSGTTTTLGVFAVLSTAGATASSTSTGTTTTGTTTGTTTASKTTHLLFLSDSGSSTVITGTGTQTTSILNLYYTTLGGTATTLPISSGIGSEQITHASFSPDTKTAVYDSLSGVAAQLVLAHTDGTGVQTLLSGGVTATGAATIPRSPSFSADGTKIVFVYNQSGTDQIYSIKPDGTGLTQLSQNFTGTNVDLPSYTKSGAVSFLSTTTSGVIQYNLISATGGRVTTTSTFGPTVAPWYTYSPDATKIVFVAQSASKSDVYTMNADGSGTAQLTRLNAVTVGNARFTADGTQVVFDAATTSTALRSLYTVKLDGTSVQTLTVSTGNSVNNTLADAR